MQLAIEQPVQQQLELVGNAAIGSELNDSVVFEQQLAEHVALEQQFAERIAVQQLAEHLAFEQQLEFFDASVGPEHNRSVVLEQLAEHQP